MNASQIVTEKIVEIMKSGKIPWKRPFDYEPPRNFFSKEPYSVLNQLLLSDTGHRSPFYASFKQITDKKWKLRAGCHGHIVTFWKTLKVTDDENPTKIKTIPFLRYYKVFSLDDVDGCPDEERFPARQSFDHTDTAATRSRGEQALTLYRDRPAIKNGESAYYAPSADTVTMPPVDRFFSVNGYYSTLFHELAHSTGHRNRLNRFTDENTHGHRRENYAKEELVAEIAAAAFCSTAGIDFEIENTAAYIQSWMSAIREQAGLLISAASKADKAVKWMTGEKTEPANIKEEKPTQNKPEPIQTKEQLLLSF